jgi:hypothetical protein
MTKPVAFARAIGALVEAAVATASILAVRSPVVVTATSMNRRRRSLAGQPGPRRAAIRAGGGLFSRS